MDSELSTHSGTRDKFPGLHGKLKKALDVEYANNKEKAVSLLGAIRKEEGIAIADLAQTLLLPGEELIPGLEPLTVVAYSIHSATDPYDPEKRLGSGNDLEMYLTNKRLLVIHAGESIYPFLEQDSPKREEWRVGHANGDSYTFMQIPLTNVHGVSLDIYNQVFAQSTVETKGRIWPAVIGGVILAVGGILLLVLNSGDYGIWGWLLLLCGAVLAAAGLLYARAKVSSPQDTQTKRGKWLRLAILEPIYVTKASFHAHIDEARNSAKLMVRWDDKFCACRTSEATCTCCLSNLAEAREWLFGKLLS